MTRWRAASDRRRLLLGVAAAAGSGLNAASSPLSSVEATPGVAAAAGLPIIWTVLQQKKWKRITKGFEGLNVAKILSGTGS